MEYYAINFHSKNAKYYLQEQTSLDSKISELMNDSSDEEDESTMGSRTEEKKFLWSNAINQKENLEIRDLYSNLSAYIEQHFDNKKQLIYKLFS